MHTTLNGSQFTDRFTTGSKKMEPSDTHVFDRLCKQPGIEHRLIPPRHPQPTEALKEWQEKRPELFTKRVYNQAGLDT